MAIAASIAVIAGLAGAVALLLRRLVRARACTRELSSEIERLGAASRREAHTDGLTRLGNRRALLRDLEEGEEPRTLAILGVDDLRRYNDAFGLAAGDTLLVRLAGRLEQAVAPHGRAYRIDGDEFCVLLDRTGGTVATARAVAESVAHSYDGFPVRCSHGSVELPDETADAAEALRLAEERMHDQKAKRSPAGRQAIDVLRQILDERGAGLADQIGQAATLAKMTAERLSLPDTEIARVRLAAELTMVGKAALPDEILSAPRPLREEEWELVRRHTLIAERIVRAAPSLAHVADLVRSSHERMDGKGYPDGLAGEQIPLGARIVAVCTAFGAMRAERPYRPEMDLEDAVAELRRCAGTQFDPFVVAAFLGAIKQGLPLLLAA